MSLDPRAHVNVKLSDYGISKYCWGGRSVGLVGTPGYQAPEILDGLAYDEKVRLGIKYYSWMHLACLCQNEKEQSNDSMFDIIFMF